LRRFPVPGRLGSAPKDSQTLLAHAESERRADFTIPATSAITPRDFVHLAA
jgi:hypothetical protein